MWSSVTLLITSAEPSAALYALNSQGIILRDVVSDGNLRVRASVRRADMDAVKRVLLRRGDCVKVLHRSGAYWRLKALLKRPVLVFGVLFAVALALYLPSRILFVQVNGNNTIPAELILSEAEACGIRFGASRRDVRSEKMKNALLEAIPQLQWAGVNTSGCVATISVREKNLSKNEEKEHTAGNVVAVRDGIIRQCTVLRGNALCQVGQAVKAGDVLISGYTDCGRVITLTRADAEVIAETSHTLRAVTMADGVMRDDFIKTDTRYSLRIGKIFINFDIDSGISDTTCVKMYEEKYITLPGGFQLPVALVCETLEYYGTSQYTQDEAPWLEDAAEKYLHSRMIAGQILGADTTVIADDDLIQIVGEYACLEMIGRVQGEEIVDTNENR